MKHVSRSALMPFTSMQMFDVVNDVARYQEFLPWCSASDILSKDAGVMLARLTIAKGGVSQQFTTRNTFTEPDAIDLHLVDGPFSTLDGRWRFQALGVDGCKIEMSLRFEMNSRILGAMLGKVFEQAADTLVDAFCRRAEQLYQSPR